MEKMASCPTQTGKGPFILGPSSLCGSLPAGPGWPRPPARPRLALLPFSLASSSAPALLSCPARHPHAPPCRPIFTPSLRTPPLSPASNPAPPAFSLLPRPPPFLALHAPPSTPLPVERGRFGGVGAALDPSARCTADVSTPGGVGPGEDARVESVSSPVSRRPAARFADSVPSRLPRPEAVRCRLPARRPQSRACAASPARAGGAGGHGAPLPAALGPGRLLAPRPAPTARAWRPHGPHRALLPPDGESRGPSVLRPRPGPTLGPASGPGEQGVKVTGPRAPSRPSGRPGRVREAACAAC